MGTGSGGHSVAVALGRGALGRLGTRAGGTRSLGHSVGGHSVGEHSATASFTNNNAGKLG